MSTPNSADHSVDNARNLEPSRVGKPAPSWRTRLLIGAQALAGGLFGFFSVTWLLPYGANVTPEGTSKVLILLCFAASVPIAMVIQVMLHELGHAIAGRWMGGYLLRFVVGPWRCMRTRSGFRWRKVRSLKGIGGFVQTLMPIGNRYRLSTSVMLLGGPLTNLACAGLAWWVVQMDEVSWPLRLMALTVALLGAFLGLINLLPFKMAGFMTDGAQLLRLWTKTAAVVDGERLTRIARASIDGQRPREYDPADVAALDPDKSTGMEQFIALVVRAAVASDRGETAQARALLDRALAQWDSWPDGFRQLLAIAAAAHSAEIEGDAETAKAWLAKAEGGLVEDFQIAWVEAEIARLEGRSADRDSALARLTQSLQDTVYRGDERIYRDKLAACTM